MVDELNFAAAFEAEEFILDNFGLYPQVQKQSNWRVLKLIFFLINAFFLLSTTIIEILIGTDFVTILNCYIFVISESNCVIKILQMFGKANILENLKSYLKLIDQSNIPVKFRKTLYGHEKFRSRIGFTYRIAIFLFVFLHVFIVLVQDERKFMPINNWFPFNVNDKHFYYSMVTYQLCIMLVSTLCDTSMDCLYYLLADVACAQLDIVKENLKEVDFKCELLVEKKLKNIAKYHQNIIKFVRDIERAFSTILFCEFLKSVVQICFTGFELTVVNFPSPRFFIHLIYFNAMFLEILSFCWFGHQLMIKSTEVEDECYMMKWHDYNNSTQKTLLIIMGRAHVPLVIKAGFINLSMTTLTAILRSSYSYTAVLRSFYNK